MTKYCDSCHTANSDRAKYCRFCHGRFSGVRFGAHTSASPLPDSLPAKGETQLSSSAPRPSQRRLSPVTRTGLLLIFLVLLLGPFSHWNDSPTPERWSWIRSSVSSAWQRSSASIAGIVKPLLAATPAVKQAERNEPARIVSRSEPPSTSPAQRGRAESAALGLDGSDHRSEAAPAEAPSGAIAAPGKGTPDPEDKGCTEARAALSLCPKE